MLVDDIHRQKISEIKNSSRCKLPPIGFPSVFGAIVGTLVPIKGALVDEHVSRKGYRVYYALNRHIQSVADAAVATDRYFESRVQTTTAIQQCSLQDTREDRTNVWNIE